MAGKWKKWTRDREAHGGNDYSPPAESAAATHTDEQEGDSFETSKWRSTNLTASDTFRSPSSATTSVPGPERAAIGASLRLVGDLSGQDDLVIHGRVDGKVTLPDNTVVVGKSGKLKANVSAKRISVEGEVEGDLTASEQIVVRRFR